MNFLKKIILQEKKMLKRISKNPTSLKVLSLIIALILFMMLNGTGPLGFGDLFETEKQISNVNVNLVTDEGKVVTGIPEKIAVNISGSEMNVNAFEENSQSISATINLTGLDDGEHKIGSDQFKFSKDYGVNIEPLVDSYDITIDTLTEVTMPINIEYVNKGQNESLILDEPILDSSDVTFEIGQKQKEEISNVKVILDVSDIDASSEDGVHIYEEQIKVYDLDGNLMEFTEDLPTVKVTQNFESQTISMPIKYQIINNNTKQYVSYVCQEKEGAVYDANCQDTVEVYGNEELIQELGYITYNVDLKNYDENSGEALATPSLQNGIYVMDPKGFNVKVGMEDGETKTFKNVSISVENLDNDLEVRNLDNVNLDVKVTGSKSIIEKMTANDIGVYIDAADITSANIVTMPLEVYANNLITYELSEKEVSVEFRDKDK